VCVNISHFQLLLLYELLIFMNSEEDMVEWLCALLTHEVLISKSLVNILFEFTCHHFDQSHEVFNEHIMSLLIILNSTKMIGENDSIRLPNRNNILIEIINYSDAHARIIRMRL
jgi:hypothetical protein